MITCTFEKGYKDNLRHTVVHALVVRQNEILLAKRAGDIPETGKWNIPGGFLQRDETANEGALRELYEETGWTGEILSLFRINSNPIRRHEDRQNIVLEFLIAPLVKSGKPDWESKDITWVPFSSLPSEDEFAFDHLDSIKLVQKYMISSFPLPVIS